MQLRQSSFGLINCNKIICRNIDHGAALPEMLVGTGNKINFRM